MPFHFCPSEADIKACVPHGYCSVDIGSVTNVTNLTRKYVQAEVQTRYSLHTYNTSSIKFVLKSVSGKLINLHAFGPLAVDLDSCAVGDTLILINFEVDICSKNNDKRSTYQIILDDQKPILKPDVWVIKASGNVTTNSLSSSAINREPASNSTCVANSSKPAIKPCQVQPKKNSYTYTLLQYVKIRTTAHVYGVVSYVRDAKKSVAEDYHMMMSIVDPSLPSLEEKLKCSLFHRDKEQLPTKANVGDVIRFHRLKIMLYIGKKQARDGPGFHWVLFQGSYDKQISSSTNYTLEACEKEKVSELFKWWNECISSTSMGSLIDRNSSPASNKKSAHIDSSPQPSTSGMSGQPSTSLATPHFLDKLTPIKSNPIMYQTLKETKVDTVTSFYGVVIFARPVVLTVQSEYHLMINLCDPSLGNRDAKLTCNLFHGVRNKLPHQAQTGDVIRFDRLKITVFNRNKQAVRNNRLDWILFQQSFESRIASSPDCVVDETEKATVQSLLDWWKKGPEETPFSKVVMRQYFCSVCQVIGVCLVEDSSYRLFKVWDGTKFMGPILEKTFEGLEEDGTLAKAAGDLVHDVYVFDDHITSTDNIKPGDYIQLTNLHAAMVSGKIEMTLHGGTTYQRGVKKLDVQNPAVTKLKAVLDPLIAKVSDNFSHVPSRSRTGNDNGDSSSKTGTTSHEIPSTSNARTPPSHSVNAETSSVRKRIFEKTGNESKTKKQKLCFCRNSKNVCVDGKCLSVVLRRCDKTNRNLLMNDRTVLGISSSASKFSPYPSRERQTDCNEGNYVTSSSSCLHETNNSNSTCFSEPSASLLVSPPSSLNLSERDRYMVESMLHKDKVEKRSKGDSDKESCGVRESAVDKSLQQSVNMSDESSSVSQGIWLSAYNSSDGSTQMNESKSKSPSGKNRVDSPYPKKTTQSNSFNRRNEELDRRHDDKRTDVANTAEKKRINVCSVAGKKRMKDNSLSGKESREDKSVSGDDQRLAYEKAIAEEFFGSIVPRTSLNKPVKQKCLFVYEDESEKSPNTSPSTLSSEHDPTLKQQASVSEHLLISSQESFHTASESRSPVPSAIVALNSPETSSRTFKAGESSSNKRTQHNNSPHSLSFKQSVLSLLSHSCVRTSAPFSVQENQIATNHRFSVVDEDLESIMSSQDSFHTAANPSSPTPTCIPTSKHLQSPTNFSPRKVLSLRSESNQSPVSNELVKKSKEFKDSSEGTVSSSNGSRQSYLPDGQQTDGDQEEISCSTDSKSSLSSREGSSSGVLLTSDNREKVTVCSVSPGRRKAHYSLETFISQKKSIKCKVLVRLQDYYPRSGNASDLVQFCCTKCNYMKSAGLKTRRFHWCPNKCGDLEPRIVVKMLLSDGVYNVNAVLWGDEAIKFFRKATPEDLLEKWSVQESVQHCLGVLCPPGAPFDSKPVMECCLFSYIIQNKMHFQVFDTVIDKRVTAKLK